MTESHGVSQHEPVPTHHGTVSAFPAVGGQRGRRRGRWWIPLLALLVLAAGVGLALYAARLTGGQPALEIPQPGTVVLLPVVDATGAADLAWIEVGLTEMMSTLLAETPRIAVVPAARLRRVVAGSGLKPGEPASRLRMRELALALGADLTVETVVRSEGKGLRLDCEIYDRKERVATASFHGAEPLALADSLVYALAKGLDADALPATTAGTFSPSTFFNRLYGMGVYAFETAGAEAAQPYFEIALRHQPRFLRAAARLAVCAYAQGDSEASQKRWLEVLQQAQGRGARRLQVESLLSLAFLSALDGNFDEADELHNQAFSILLGLGDGAGQTDVLGRRARIALSRRDRGQAEGLFFDILKAQADRGDRVGRAATLLQLGTLALEAENLDTASELFTEARDLARSLSDLRTEMRAVSSLGEVAHRQGRLDAAEEHWRQALAFYKQRQEEQSTQLLLTRNLAQLALARGTPDEAEERFHDVLDLAKPLGDRESEGLASLHLARIILEKGYPYQAKPHLDRALELDRYIGDRFALQLLIARYAYEQSNFRLAHETLLAAREQAAERWTPRHEATLRAYSRALVYEARQPLPGEADYVEGESPLPSP